jgi:hypothetical protein
MVHRLLLAHHYSPKKKKKKKLAVATTTTVLCGNSYHHNMLITTSYRCDPPLQRRLHFVACGSFNDAPGVRLSLTMRPTEPTPLSQGRTLGNKSDESGGGGGGGGGSGGGTAEDDSDSSSSREKHDRDVESPTAVKRRREADREKRLARFARSGSAGSSSSALVSAGDSLSRMVVGSAPQLGFTTGVGGKVSSDGHPVGRTGSGASGNVGLVGVGQRVRTKSENEIEADRAKRLVKFGQRAVSASSTRIGSGGSAAVTSAVTSARTGSSDSLSPLTITSRTPASANSSIIFTPPASARATTAAATARARSADKAHGTLPGRKRLVSESEASRSGRPFHEWAKDWIAVVLGVSLSTDTDLAALPELTCGSLASDCIAAHSVAEEPVGTISISSCLPLCFCFSSSWQPRPGCAVTSLQFVQRRLAVVSVPHVLHLKRWVGSGGVCSARAEFEAVGWERWCLFRT